MRLIVRGRADDAPVLHTVFTPLTIARKLAGEQLRADLRSTPEVVLSALETITTTMTRYALAALEAGADGLFLATQTASREVFAESEHNRFDLPFTRRIAEDVAGRSMLTLLHIHGRDIAFDTLAALPVQAINWHDRLTRPSLEEASRRFAGAVVGGINEWETLRRGPAAVVAAEADDALRRTGGIGLILAPGCGLPLDVPDAHLEAVVGAVRGHRGR